MLALGPLVYMFKLVVSVPLCLFLAILLGWLLRRRRPRLSRWLVGAGLSALVLLSMPWCSAALLRALQRFPALVEPGSTDAQAVVILSAGVVSFAPEFGTPTVDRLTLERLRYGARLAREAGLPVLVAGGPSRADLPARAELMRAVLEQDFDLGVRWVEGDSGDTLGNARGSRLLLEADGIRRVLLVTHAWHMRRAVAAFESAGLSVVPAPTAFRQWPHLDLGSLAPSARSLQESSWALHEWLGLLWYRLVA